MASSSADPAVGDLFEQAIARTAQALADAGLATETLEAEGGRLASARTWVALRRRPRLMRAIAEAQRPAVEPFDWGAWRDRTKAVVAKHHQDRHGVTQ